MFLFYCLDVKAEGMNEADQSEWNYRYTERLGIMCGTSTPTPEQEQIARSEADRAIEELIRDRYEDKIIQRDLRTNEHQQVTTKGCEQ